MSVKLPDFAKPRPEDIAAQAELQARRNSRARLTEEERVLARAAEQEEVARGNMRAAQAAYAEALAMRGDFRRAKKMHPSKEARAHFRRLEAAIKLDDEKECRCKPQKVAHAGVTIELPKHHEAARVFSQKHGAVVPVEQCRKCKRLNARPATTPRGEAGTPDAVALKVEGAK